MRRRGLLTSLGSLRVIPILYSPQNLNKNNIFIIHIIIIPKGDIDTTDLLLKHFTGTPPSMRKMCWLRNLLRMAMVPGKMQRTVSGSPVLRCIAGRFSATPYTRMGYFALKPIMSPIKAPYPGRPLPHAQWRKATVKETLPPCNPERQRHT